MKLIGDMYMRLLTAAGSIKWEIRENPELVAHTFRGGDAETDVPLPLHARGLIIGRYPVIACALRLTSRDDVEKDLRAAHNQMMIARSYLSDMQVIDAHIFFVAETPVSDFDWKQQVDSIQRNEIVCRKLVWIRDSGDVEASFESFIGRSFLAQPWQNVSELIGAPLDHNERLVERVLESLGLSAEAASAWVELTRTPQDDERDFVERLVAAMEEKA